LQQVFFLLRGGEFFALLRSGLADAHPLAPNLALSVTSVKVPSRLFR
jgi:hypothetical protein